MEILKEDKKYGKIKVRITNMDDLWYLYNIIKEDDIVFSLIHRKEEQRQDTIRSKKTKRVPMRVGIRVEDMEFQDFSNRLRIGGTIEKGPEDVLGEHQSINLSVMDDCSIVKNDWSIFLSELDKAVKSSKTAKVKFLAMDERSATIAILRDYAIQEIATLHSSQGKAYDTDDKSVEFFSEITKTVEENLDDQTYVICLGPGFAKDNFKKYCDDKSKFKKMLVVQASHGNMRGIYEIMKTGVIDKILKDSRVKEEISLINTLMMEIKKDGLYSYGMEETRKAIEIGALETLMVTDKVFRAGDVSVLMKKAKDSNAKIVIVSISHEGGKMLESLGGVAGLLRYKLSS